MDVTQLHLVAGWSSMVAGALSGAILGLQFHRETWLGGYASFPRRMVRLGHIAFFGLGILNVLFALTVIALPLPPPYERAASAGFLVAAATMPACCFLTAWKAGFRHMFPVPVAGVLAGLGALLGGWVVS